jgi:hypothetical protein
MRERGRPTGRLSRATSAVASAMRRQVVSLASPNSRAPKMLAV